VGVVNAECGRRKAEGRQQSHPALHVPGSAILLIGPTGSGKTPLGRLIEKARLRARRCVHFDLGENLRKVAAVPDHVSFLAPDDLKIVVECLMSGRLLKDSEFHIARKILLSFARANGVGEDDILVLNGLPRHIGQAVDIDEVVKIEAVVYLKCSAEVVAERIRLNTGGDRTLRVDDSPDEVQRKLRIFEEQTIPLLDHYRRKGVRIIEVDVGPDSTPIDMKKAMEDGFGCVEIAD